MTVEVALNTPLADALNAAIQPKLVEVGWGTGGGDEAALAEYIVLMLVNGKDQSQIAVELAGDLLGLSPEDPGARDFAKWLFEQIDLLNGQINGQAATGEDNTTNNDVGEMDTDMGAGEASGLNAPTGPRSMRNGNNRGGREKRMMGFISKAMDRTPDSGIHRVRGQTGNERINTHGRTPPTGPRTGAGRLPRNNNNNNNRAASIQHGLATMGNQGFNMMPGQQGSQMDVYAMLEQQNQMMFQLSQQLMQQQSGGYQNQRRGKSLFDRVQDPHKNHQRRGQGQGPKTEGGATAEGGEGGDVEMGGNKGEATNPEDTVCKYNLNCTNRECKFAHQSPAAPHGTSVDVSDNCTYGAACKNRKCVARHPSPAAKLAHQGEQDCKFFPNCQNPRCPFKHPSMPLCRNGADCTTSNCKFTHVKTKCKFNPCLNPTCAFAHDAGQQGGFKDKVWTADSTKEHVSDRKFIDEEAGTELVQPDDETVQPETKIEEDAEVIA